MSEEDRGVRNANLHVLITGGGIGGLATASVPHQP
jgi:hypothetical protein